ncbi:MAG: DUF3971 domain-containing protein [Pseudomonadota bacterium]|nr:DUF3971 domain-containing protein [Pseudomonadota bacterium]
MKLFLGLFASIIFIVSALKFFLPNIDEYSSDIRRVVLETSGFEINYESLNFGVSIYGPELRLKAVEAKLPNEYGYLNFEEININFDFINLIFSGLLSPNRVFINGSSINIEIKENETIFIQGRPLGDYFFDDKLFDPKFSTNFHIHIENLDFSFIDSYANRPALYGVLEKSIAEINDGLLDFEALIGVERSIRETIEFKGKIPLDLALREGPFNNDSSWSLWLSSENLFFGSWLEIFQIQELPILNGNGSLTAEFSFLGVNLVELIAELDLSDVKLSQENREPALIDSLEGEITWNITENGWKLTSKDLFLARSGDRSPVSNILLDYSLVEGKEELIGSADFVRTNYLSIFLRAINDDRIEKFIVPGDFNGDIRDLDLKVNFSEGTLDTYLADGKFESLSYISKDQDIDLRGLSGPFNITDRGGSVELATKDAVIAVNDLFHSSFPLKSVLGLITWTLNSEGYKFQTNNLEFEMEEGQGKASIELTTKPNFFNPIIDLRANISLRSLIEIERYLPKKIPERVIKWLDYSIQDGSVSDANFKLRGPLKTFPYRNNEGEFLIKIDFDDLNLRYAKDWPEVENASGQLIFNGPSLYSTKNNFSIAGIKFKDINAKILDLRQGIINLEAPVSTDLPKVLNFLTLSPVSKIFGNVLDGIKISGPAIGELSINLPIRNIKNWSLDGYFDTREANLNIEGFSSGFTNLNGRANLKNSTISLVKASAEFLSTPVTLSVTPLVDSKYRNAHMAEVLGEFDINNIAEIFSIPVGQYFSGTSLFKASALLNSSTKENFNLSIDSDLVGLISKLPFPLSKQSLVIESLNLNLQFQEKGIIELNGSLARGLNWLMELRSNNQGWSIYRGIINRGNIPKNLPIEPGLVVSGYIDTFSVDDWVSLSSQDLKSKAQTEDPNISDIGSTKLQWIDSIRFADFQINELFVFGFRFIDIDAQIRFATNEWDIDIRGPWLEGNIRIPLDFNEQTAISLDMDRLLLIENAVKETKLGSEEASIDPRTLPAISAKVQDFAINKYRFGSLVAEIGRVPDGLKSNLIKTNSTSFNTDISADWLVIDSAQRSRFIMNLESQDVASTLQQLGQESGVSGESAKIDLSLLWEGGPSSQLIYDSTGKLNFDIRNGRINNLSTGSGRLIGLFSLGYLPRRLALDFKDILNDGMEFNSLSGDFRLDFGNAWTCNMGLISEIADIAMVGRTGLLTQDYDQLAVVRPHVSNMLPLPAAVLGGPAAGVATLLISQLFKKPLSNIGETYYSIEGSWNNPLLTKKLRMQIDTASFADCEKELPNFSIEEITVLEELFENSGSLAPNIR